MKKNIAIVLLANRRYLIYFEKIYNDLRNVGKFTGDIILLTDYKTNCSSVKNINDNKLFIKRFKKIKFPFLINKQLNKIKYGRNKSKSFQWQKLYLFHEYFKKWDHIFYLDINMKVKNDINPLINLEFSNTLYAPYDAYPDLDWKLKSQFDEKNIYFNTLSKEYDLENPRYFQTGILFFDTNIIEKNTLENLLILVKKFPISKNNEQGILNLYFLYDFPVFERLPVKINDHITYSYWDDDNKNAIITKKNRNL